MYFFARYLLANSFATGLFTCLSVHAQTIRVIDNKGTLNDIESSKWTLQGTDIFNKNSGNVGIGLNPVPTSTLHVFGDARVEGAVLDSSGDMGLVEQVLTSTGTGTNWVTSSVWSLTGNAATNPAANFLGTTDDIDLVFRTNNIEKFRIFSLANPSLGIGRNSLVGVNGPAFNFSGPTLFLGDAGNVSSSSGIDFIIDDDNNATNTQFRFRANGDGNTGTTELLQINESGHVGIGLAGSTAQATLHTSGSLRFQGLSSTTVNVNVLTTDVDGNVANKALSNIVAGISSNTATAPLTLDAGATAAVLGATDATLTVNNTAPIWNANQLQGNSISANPPNDGDVLQWNTTTASWTPNSVGSLSSKISMIKSSNQTSSSITLTSVTDLSTTIELGKRYDCKCHILFSSSNTGNGIGISVNAPTGFALNVVMPRRSLVNNGNYTANLTQSGDTSALSNRVPVGGTIYVAEINGILIPITTGTFQVTFRSELDTGTNNVTAYQGSFCFLEEY